MEDEQFSTARSERDSVAVELGGAGFADAVEVGRGAFDVVYRATQVELDRVVAIKVLTEMLEENRPRFLREQQAMGRLTGHPHIVPVLEIGETFSGYPYLVMPFHRQDSLQTQISQLGRLPLEEVLRLGVKVAGALESAHRLGIAHRDVKPANILLTDYGEPALSDFGIARISGGFETAAGIISGTPAFTAPEVLGGDVPSAASDVYGLGATLFCALTGHAAFQRRTGEQLVTQFLRIATEPVPDLREHDISDDVAAIVERTMSREPGDRPSALAVGQEMQDLQARHGLIVDTMALWSAEPHDQMAKRRVKETTRGSVMNVPAQLGRVVGRRAELAQLRHLLSTSRLVTMTGVGGVGKTTLAIQAARELLRGFPHGVWLVELGDLREGSLLGEVVAAAVGLRDQSGRPLTEVLVEFLASRRALVVLDNCEHLLDAVAQLTQSLLGGCPELHILATSREILGIAGEAVLGLGPLSYPNDEAEPTLSGLSDYAAVELFAELARAAVDGFVLAEHNAAAVARICSQLEGLPLAIELAAARLRAMSAQQIADGLSDRYRLLTRGRRGNPPRQQTLSLSVGWSYELCTPVEQRLWARLSVFAGSFELSAAQEVCGEGLNAEAILDAVSALVEKSILTRVEHNNAVRFRLLETLREYGRERIDHAEQFTLLRRRHADWYGRLVIDDAEWFGPQQVQWLKRFADELPNLREALQFSLLNDPARALEMTFAMRHIWFGMLSEGRRWMDLALIAAPEPTVQRIHALYVQAGIADMQGDPSAAHAPIAEARRLLEDMANPIATGQIEFIDGFTGLLCGDLQRARDCLERALVATDDFEVQAFSMIIMGWVRDLSGEPDQAMDWYEKALALTEPRDEAMYRGRALAAVGAGRWRQGELQSAQQMLRQSLRLTLLINDLWASVQVLEILGWIEESNDQPRRAATMMAAAAAVSHDLGAPTPTFVLIGDFHDECERRAREQLGPRDFEAAWRHGTSLTLDQTITFALGDND
jgi:non-specific serine/threonine protein kinase